MKFRIINTKLKRPATPGEIQMLERGQHLVFNWYIDRERFPIEEVNKGIVEPEVNHNDFEIEPV